MKLISNQRSTENVQTWLIKFIKKLFTLFSRAYVYVETVPIKYHGSIFENLKGNQMNWMFVGSNDLHSRIYPDNKVHGAYHGPMNLAIRVVSGSR